MERLLYELENAQMAQVWLENRTLSLNRKEMQMIDALRGRRIIRRLRVDIAKPLEEEPMLWVPDAVAGAVTAARKGSPQHRATLEVRFTYGVPSKRENWGRRNPKFSLLGRHFRVSTRRSRQRLVNDPG